MHTIIIRIHPTLLLLLLCLVSCDNADNTIPSPKRQRYCLGQTFKASIRTTTVQSEPVTQSIPLTGAVEPNPDKVVHFVSLVSGIVSQTFFSLGDKVTKGQVLAYLRSSQLSDLEAQLKIIDAQISVATKKLQSMQAMFDDGVASHKDLTEAQSDLAIVKAEADKIRSHLQLYSASSEQGVFLIKAPATGIITAKSIAAGTQISANGDVLFTITDLSEVWVLVNVYASNVTNISIGMGVSIKTLSYPNEEFKGTIAAISQVLDADAKVMKARVVLPNADLRLKPGMIVDVAAVRHLETHAISIPTSAIIFDANQNYVVVYRSDCDLEIRQVEVLLKSNGTTYISAGLRKDEQIVVNNQLLIYEQLKNFYH